MKASLKFRDDQKPLFRAKVPLNLLGFPFQSGIAAGESKELSLSLGTFFESGPSLRVAYRPNDSWNPFSLVVKTGMGPYGSPDSASMTMSAEFNPLELGNPSFFIRFKPRLGDFSLKKSQSSSPLLMPKGGAWQNGGVASDDDAAVEVVDRPAADYASGGLVDGKLAAPPSPRSSAAGFIGSLLSGMEVSARTAVPVRNGAVLSCRWGVRFPEELRRALTDRAAARVSLQKLPMLVMNKIAIEHAADRRSKASKTENGDRSLSFLSAGANADLAGACFGAQRQMEVLQADNELLKKAIEGLRSEMVGGGSAPSIGAADSDEKSGSRSPNGKSDRKKPSEIKASAGKGIDGDGIGKV